MKSNKYRCIFVALLYLIVVSITSLRAQAPIEASGMLITGNSLVGEVKGANGSIYVQCRESITMAPVTTNYSIAILVKSNSGQESSVTIPYNDIARLTAGIRRVEQTRTDLTKLADCDVRFSANDTFHVSKLKKSGELIPIQTVNVGSATVRIEGLSLLRDQISRAKAKLDEIRNH